MSNYIQVLKSSSCDFSNLKESFILIDTNFLIDGIRYPEVFGEIIGLLKNTPCSFVTIDAVKYEFLRGSDSVDIYKKKVDYYNEVIDSTLVIEKQIQENSRAMTQVLLKRSRGLHYTDSLLLGTLMKYNNGKTYLLSKDRSDITTSIFPVTMSLLVETYENNNSFSIYSYDEKEYLNCLKKLIKQ